MNQEITISLNTFDYLDKNLPAYEINDAQQIIGYLKENYFVVDSKLEYVKMLWKKIDDLKEERNKKYFKELFEKLIKKNKVVNCTNIDGLIMAEQSNDKIFLNPTIENKETKRIVKKHPIEIHNSQSFISPETYHKLKHSKAILQFEQDIPYDLAEILAPYLRNTSTIIIEDPFLPNEYANNNLRLIIEATNCKNLNLTLLKERDYIYDKSEKKKEEKTKRYKSLNNYIKSLEEEGYSIKVNEYKERNHKERFIYTDDVRISLPGGLDFLNMDGKLTNNEDREVRVDRKE